MRQDGRIFATSVGQNFAQQRVAASFAIRLDTVFFLSFSTSSSTSSATSSSLRMTSPQLLQRFVNVEGRRQLLLILDQVVRQLGVLPPPPLWQRHAKEGQSLFHFPDESLAKVAESDPVVAEGRKQKKIYHFLPCVFCPAVEQRCFSFQQTGSFSCIVH